MLCNEIRIASFFQGNYQLLAVRCSLHQLQLGNKMSLAFGLPPKFLSSEATFRLQVTTSSFLKQWWGRRQCLSPITPLNYQLNLNNLDAVDICKLILRENKRNLTPYIKVYSEEIEKFQADIIIIFGSILTKRDFNDVDVLFITDKVKEVNKFCNEISKIRAKTINPLIMTFNDLINNIKNKHKVILEIMNKGVILKGEDNYMEALKNAG